MKKLSVNIFLILFLFSFLSFFNPEPVFADRVTCKVDLWIDPPGSKTVVADWFATADTSAYYDVYLDTGSGLKLVGKLLPDNNFGDSGTEFVTFSTTGQKDFHIKSGVGCDEWNSITIPDVVSNPQGTVCIASNISTTGTVTGPDSFFPYNYNGTSWCRDVDVGTYTLSSVPTIAGYSGPSINNPSTQTLTDGGSISWNITYTQNLYRCSGGGSCIMDNVSGNTTSSNCNNSCSVTGAPTVSISANPSTVSYGGSSTIIWSASNASSCSVTPTGWGGTTGSQSSGALYSTTVYTVNCSGPGGSASNSATVNVGSVGSPSILLRGWGPPSVPQSSPVSGSLNISANSMGGLVWSKSNVNYCELYRNGTGLGTDAQWPSQSAPVGPVTQTTYHTLICNGLDGSQVQSSFTHSLLSASSVNIRGWGPPTNSVTDGPVSIAQGSTGAVAWTSTGATYCELYQNGVFTGHTQLSPASIGVGPINAPTTYQVNCTNGSDISSDIITFNPIGPVSVDIKGWGPPTNVSTDGPVNITQGSTGAVSWISVGATNCNLYENGAFTGHTQLSAPSVGVGPINNSTTYQVNCSNGVDIVGDSITFNPQAQVYPDLTAGSVSPTIATVNSALTFSGGISNSGAASTGSSFNNLFQVSSAGNGGGSISTISVNSMATLGAGVSGSINSSAHTFTSAGTYSVRLCADGDESFNSGIVEGNEKNNCGSWTNIIVSNPVAAPTVSISALPTSVVTNGSSTLTWSVGGQVTSCSASGGWSGSKSISGGSQLVNNISTDTTYTITCTGPGGTATQGVTVTVTDPPSVTLTASPTSVGAGGSSNLTWTTSGNISSCTASGGWSGTKSTAGGSQSTGSISSATTYTITCTGPGGTSSDSVTVSITAGPVVTLTASPSTVASGGSSTLTWTVSGSVTSCTASGSSSWSGSKSTSGGSQTISGITTDLTFTLSCTGPGGTTVQSTSVTVISAPTVSLTATPSSISSGGSSTLTWTVSGSVTSCTASGGWSGSKSTSGGSQSTGSISSATTYSISCTGPGGTSNSSVTINITSGPVVTLTASPSSVSSGGSSTLTWTVSGSVTSCTASGGWSGSKSTSGGSQDITSIPSTTTFTLSCTGPGGTTVQSTTVNVQDAPSVVFTASPSAVASGGSSTLTWSVSGTVDSCVASGAWSGSKSTSGGNQSTGSIFAPSTYTLTCNGPGGSDTQTVNVSITSGPVVTFTASPSSVSSGGSSTLTWTVSGSVTSCTASGSSSWSGSKSTSGGSQMITNITSDTTFVLSCTGPGGTTVQSQTVTVNSAPSVSLVATPSAVSSGGSTVLSWSVSGADTCTASGNWTGGKSATGGNETVNNITSSKTFTLSCSGPGGSRSDTVTVSITAGPVISISANPGSVNSGDTTTISWTVSGSVTSCTASGGWSGSKSTSGGTEVSGSITTDTTFTLSCTGPGGSNVQSATVTVIGVTVNYPNAPTISGSATYTNTPYTFTITGTDSSGEDVRYGIDWNMDGSADEWLPASPPITYVTSGTSRSVSHSWASPGTYTFQALTQNKVSGQNSGWTTKTVTVADLIVDAPGQCGTANNRAYPYGSSSFNPYTLCQSSYGTTPASVPFPGPGSSQPWTCNGSGTGSPASCTASQNQATAVVTVNVVANGGSVSGGGISNCTGVTGICTTTVTVGSSLTLTATPSSSYWQFNGWDLSNPSGICYTAGNKKTCTFIVGSSAPIVITASFGPRKFDYKEF